MTDHHFYTFGYIIVTFAKIERGLRYYIAHILNTDIAMVSILTKPYSVRHYQNVIKSFMEMPDFDEAHKDELNQLLGRLKPLQKIRNYIAHSAWIAGARPDSIKPLDLYIHNNKPEFWGIDDEEKDYTQADLDAFAVETENLQADFIRFYKTHGISTFASTDTAE